MKNNEKGLLVPYGKLSESTKMELLKSYIEREGTDYGLVEKSADEKIRSLMEQLQAEKVFIVYDEETESVNLLSKLQVEELGLLDSV